jgi:hypothetical protein
MISPHKHQNTYTNRLKLAILERALLVLKHGTFELGCLLLSRVTPITAYMLQGHSDDDKYSLNITGIYQGFFKYH